MLENRSPAGAEAGAGAAFEAGAEAALVGVAGYKQKVGKADLQLQKRQQIDTHQ